MTGGQSLLVEVLERFSAQEKFRSILRLQLTIMLSILTAVQSGRRGFSFSSCSRKSKKSMLEIIFMMHAEDLNTTLY